MQINVAVSGLQPIVYALLKARGEGNRELVNYTCYRCRDALDQTTPPHASSYARECSPFG